MAENIGKHVPHYIDTSVAVKLFVTEDGSDRIQRYFGKRSNWANSYHITEFAFYETLSVLKVKLRRPIEKGRINEDTYHKAVFELIGYLDNHLLQIDADFRLDDWKVLIDVGKLVQKHSLDYSDALQLYTVLNGKWRGRPAEYTTVFVTADSALAKAAKNEGLRVWNPLKEDNP